MNVRVTAPGTQTETYACGLPCDAMPAHTDLPITPEERTLEIVESAYEPAPCSKAWRCDA